MAEHALYEAFFRRRLHALCRALPLTAISFAPAKFCGVLVRVNHSRRSLAPVLLGVGPVVFPPPPFCLTIVPLDPIPLICSRAQVPSTQGQRGCSASPRRYSFLCVLMASFRNCSEKVSWRGSAGARLFRSCFPASGRFLVILFAGVPVAPSPP